MRFVAYTLFLVVLLWFTSQVVYPTSQTITHGFATYYSAARLLHRGPLPPQVYDPAYFRPIVRADTHQQADDIYYANPPTTALLLWPLSFLPIGQTRLIWTIANVLMLFGGLIWLGLTFNPRLTLPGLVGLLTLGMCFQPALANLKYGQAYLPIFFLLTLMVIALDKKQVSWGGMALAVALILKTAGWALLPLLAWQRHWSALAWVLGGLAGIVVLTLPLFPLPVWASYFDLLGQMTASPQSCAIAYQTTRSLLCRLLVFEPTWSPSPLFHLPWLSTLLLAGLAAFTLAVILGRANRQPLAALMAVIIWGVLFAPLGEQYHHTVMLIPLTWLLVNGSAIPRNGRIILALAVILYLIPLHWTTMVGSNGWLVWLAYPRLYGGWLLFILILKPHLPGFNSFNRINQHDDIQGQVVSNQEKQHQFCDHKKNERPPPAQPIGQHKAQPAGENIAH